MKIAIPTRQNVVEEHFGQSRFFTVFEINDSKQILNSDLYQAPNGCGCRSNIADIFRKNGIGVLLAGEMGEHSATMMNQAGITLVRGCSGDVQNVAQAFLAGSLLDSGNACHHDDHDHHGHCHHDHH